MFHCPVGVWVIEQHAMILIATVYRDMCNIPIDKVILHIWATRIFTDTELLTACKPVPDDIHPLFVVLLGIFYVWL